MGIKQRSRGWLTRSISFLLTFIMIFSLFPTTALADSPIIGDGTGESGITTNGQWRANWNISKQGVRISIVDTCLSVIFQDFESINLFIPSILSSYSYYFKKDGTPCRLARAIFLFKCTSFTFLHIIKIWG